MNFNSFKESLQNNTPPEGISPYLKALWYDGKNDWEKAHNIIQDIEDSNGSWIHAYLHRKEGDMGMQIIGIGERIKKGRMFLWRKNGENVVIAFSRTIIFFHRRENPRPLFYFTA